MSEKTDAMDEAYKIVEKFGLKDKSFKFGKADGFEAMLKITDAKEGFKTAIDLVKAFEKAGWTAAKQHEDLSPQYNKKGSQVDFIVKINVSHDDVSVYAEEAE